MKEFRTDCDKDVALFKVEQKKHSRYVQTLGEMSHELLQRGIDGTKLFIAPPGE